jgi:hypothetical protein
MLSLQSLGFFVVAPSASETNSTNIGRGLVLGLHTPLFPVRLFRLFPDIGMPVRQQERVGVAHSRFDNAEVTRRIEKARVPPLPVRQQFFDFGAQVHAANVYEQTK